MRALSRAFLLIALLASAASADEASDFEPIQPFKLIELLPSNVKDFKAAKPTGTTTGEFGSKTTIVSRVYTYRGDDDELEEDAPKPTVTIKISDSVASKSFPLLHGKLAEMGQTSTSGFSNALSVDGHLAIRNYREKDQVGMLSVYVADRFFLQVAVRGLPEKTLMDWWNKIDTEKLAALAVPPTPTPASTPTPATTPTQASAS